MKHRKEELKQKQKEAKEREEESINFFTNCKKKLKEISYGFSFWGEEI